MLNQTRDNRIRQNIIIGDDNIEVMEHFTYLGVELKKRCKENSEVQKRIIVGNKANYALSTILGSRQIHRSKNT